MGCAAKETERMAKHMKTVIVGGVAGGASAAARLRRLDESAEIIMLEKGRYISYANCGLPYYIGGEIAEEASLLMQTPESFRSRYAVDVRTGHEALAIDPTKKAVTILEHATGRQYEEAYDKLILAPGAEPVRPPLPGADHPRVFTLRTVADALAIRQLIRQPGVQRAVIIGGGFIGLEMAENLMNAGLSVALVEAGDHVMAPLDYDTACSVHQYLRTKQVDLRLRCRVTALQPQTNSLRVVLDDGTSLGADFVLLAVGIRPDTALAKAAGLATNARGAIVVDKHMRTSNPDIYAVGDAVEVPHLVSGLPSHIPLAGPANRQGRTAADHICGRNGVYRGSMGSSVLKLFDMTIACTGLNEAAAKAAGLEYDKTYLGALSHSSYYPSAERLSLKILFEQGTGRILGAQVTGFGGVDKRCDVLAAAICAGMTACDLADLELCYSPPYSTPRDPVNTAGFTIENLLADGIRQFHWHDIEVIQNDPNAVLLYVDNPKEGQTILPGSLTVPLDALRDRLNELEPKKTLYVYSSGGIRAYSACRLLSQKGFDCRTLSGGTHLLDIIRKEQALLPSPKEQTK